MYASVYDKRFDGSLTFFVMAVCFLPAAACLVGMFAIAICRRNLLLLVEFLLLAVLWVFPFTPYWSIESRGEYMYFGLLAAALIVSTTGLVRASGQKSVGEADLGKSRWRCLVDSGSKEFISVDGIQLSRIVLTTCTALTCIMFAIHLNSNSSSIGVVSFIIYAGSFLPVLACLVTLFLAFCRTHSFSLFAEWLLWLGSWFLIICGGVLLSLEASMVVVGAAVLMSMTYLWRDRKTAGSQVPE